MSHATALDTQNCVSEHVIRDLLRRENAKSIANVVQRSHRTVQGWLQGRSQPSGSELLRLMRANDDLRTEILRLIAD